MTKAGRKLPFDRNRHVVFFTHPTNKRMRSRGRSYGLDVMYFGTIDFFLCEQKLNQGKTQ